MADPFGWAVMRRMLSDDERPSRPRSVDWTEAVVVAVALTLVGVLVVTSSAVSFIGLLALGAAWLLYRPGVSR